MKLYLKRIRKGERVTDGELLTERGEHICDTTEHTKTMLPKGSYSLQFRKNPKFSHRAPYAVSTDFLHAHRAFLIHGNGAWSSKLRANILVGDYLVPGVVIKSYACFDLLMDRLEKSLQRCKEVLLIIE